MNSIIESGCIGGGSVMLLCPAKNHSCWQAKTVKGTIIAALVVMGGFVINFVEAPRSAVYSIFREINKYSVAFQTRGWESIQGENFEIRYHPEDVR